MMKQTTRGSDWKFVDFPCGCKLQIGWKTISTRAAPESVALAVLHPLTEYLPLVVQVQYQVLNK